MGNTHNKEQTPRLARKEFMNILTKATVLVLLSVPRAPKELPVLAHIRYTSEVEDWKLFLTS